MATFNVDWAARQINIGATAYHDRLLHRRVLFIPSNGLPPIECAFNAENFMHLCGVSYTGNITKETFFRKAMQATLVPSRLQPTRGKLTIFKLKVLRELCFVDCNATAAVIDPVSHQGTFADLFCANARSTMGFKRLANGLYVPKTALDFYPPKEEPGYRNIIAIVKTEPDSIEYTIVSKEPKTKNKTTAKHDAIIRSLMKYHDRNAIEPILDYSF